MRYTIPRPWLRYRFRGGQWHIGQPRTRWTMTRPTVLPCRPERGDCCTGSAHTWQPAQGSRLPDRVDGNTPSDALYGDLTASNPAAGVAAPDDRTERAK